MFAPPEFLRDAYFCYTWIPYFFAIANWSLIQRKIHGKWKVFWLNTWDDATSSKCNILRNMNFTFISVISDFLRGVTEICAVRGFTHRRMAVPYRRFGTIYQSYLQGSSSSWTAVPMEMEQIVYHFVVATTQNFYYAVQSAFYWSLSFYILTILFY